MKTTASIIALGAVLIAGSSAIAQVGHSARSNGHGFFTEVQTRLMGRDANLYLASDDDDDRHDDDHRKKHRKHHDDDDDDDDEGGRGGRNAAPAGSTTPPANGLFNGGQKPKVKMN